MVALNAANCATGESIAREQREAESKETVLTELGQAATSLRARLGESLPSIEKFDAPIERATTPSLEALRAFTEGRRLNAAAAFDKAVPFLQRAVELDPNFAMGYYLLGTAHGNMGQYRLQRENLTKAFQLRERGRELERLSISALYSSQVLGDVNSATETYMRLKETYPRDYVARLLLGNTTTGSAASKRPWPSIKKCCDSIRGLVRSSFKPSVAHTCCPIASRKPDRLSRKRSSRSAKRLECIASFTRSH